VALPLHAELKRRRVFRALVGYGIAAPPSIAVLPLADMSPGKDQEYFSDGVAEEISAGYERAMAAAEKAVELEPGQVWFHAGSRSRRRMPGSATATSPWAGWSAPTPSTIPGFPISTPTRCCGACTAIRGSRRW